MQLRRYVRKISYANYSAVIHATSHKKVALCVLIYTKSIVCGCKRNFMPVIREYLISKQALFFYPILSEIRRNYARTGR